MNKRSIVKREVRSFTQFDPFEDTESLLDFLQSGRVHGVSPNSIRSRILKGKVEIRHRNVTAVSPNSIRSRILKAKPKAFARASPSAVSPNSIRSRILKGENISIL